MRWLEPEVAEFGIQENIVLILIKADLETNREALRRTMMKGKRMVVCGVVESTSQE